MGSTPQISPTSNSYVTDDALIDVEIIEERVKNSLLHKVRYLVQSYPDRALEVIQGWMAERQY